MSIELIQSYEDRLIANDKSVCFYEMMQETYNLIGEKHSVCKESLILLKKQQELKAVDLTVNEIIGYINQGYGTNQSIKLAGKVQQTFYKSISLNQRERIVSAKLNYTKEHSENYKVPKSLINKQ